MNKEEFLKRVIRIIAATRYPFIDDEDWPNDFITLTNLHEKKVGIESEYGKVYPSIVIVDGEDKIREVGEIITSDLVEKSQIMKWKLISEKTGMGRKTKKFFLYVPEGSEDKALNLLQSNHIAYAGLRTWAVQEGHLKVRPITTPDAEDDHRSS